MPVSSQTALRPRNGGAGSGASSSLRRLPSRPRRSVAATAAVVVAVSAAAPAHELPIACDDTADCQAAVHPRSECRPVVDADASATYYCTNPFASGCFRALDDADDADKGRRGRVCNSEDLPEAIGTSCYVPDDLSYMELRLFTHNWESVHLENWLLQIILSEFLDVPTSLETGVSGRQMNFYHPFRALDGGSDSESVSLAVAAEYGDCLSLPHRNRAPDDDAHHNATGDDAYQPCAHMATEIWGTEAAQKMARDGIIEAPQGLGVLGEEGWFVPKFTAMKDPSMLHYLGLQGPERRQKLAETFLRPTTWADYCQQVSANNCTEPDEVATRAPRDDSEAGRYFAEDGAFTGFFRATEENDCEVFPNNCTGHIADYPCGWSSYVTQQAHHLDIAVASSGPEPGARGYPYDSLLEIWHAANWTKSDVILYWWTPHPLVDIYEGTDAAFMRITLPKPTQQCEENRITEEARCSLDDEERWGGPEGACDDPPKPLQKVISKGLWKATHGPAIPEAIRSPAYDLAKLFTIDTLQLSEIFEYRKQFSDPRHAVCAWAVDNKAWIEGLLPPGYPREIKEASQQKSLYIAALAMGSLASVIVLSTAVGIYRFKARKIIKSAQIEFLALLLLGLLLIATGSIVMAVPVSSGTCIAASWLLLVGYTIELVPLLVKISAINLLVHAARGHRRVVLQRQHLFKTVAAISICVAIYLVLWTVLDPPTPKSGFFFGAAAENDSGNVVLETAAFCSSESKVWMYVAIGWTCILLLSGFVLAFQSRKIKMKDFNESSVVGLMVYSQCLFLIARIIISTVLAGHISEAAVSYSSSIIFSTDVIVTTFIYFLPKFKKQPLKKRTSSVLDLVTASVLEGISERRVSAFSCDLESTSFYPEAILPHRSSCTTRSEQPSQPSLQCPRCGYSAIDQGDVGRPLLDNGANNSIPPKMQFSSSEETSTPNLPDRRPGSSSTVPSTDEVNDGETKHQHQQLHPDESELLKTTEQHLVHSTRTDDEEQQESSSAPVEESTKTTQA